METEVKFSGYLQRQHQEIKLASSMEDALIPEDFRYSVVKGLRAEFIEKLEMVKPYSLGQARRIPGMTPTALALIAVELKKGSAKQAA